MPPVSGMAGSGASTRRDFRVEPPPPAGPDCGPACPADVESGIPLLLGTGVAVAQTPHGLRRDLRRAGDGGPGLQPAAVAHHPGHPAARARPCTLGVGGLVAADRLPAERRHRHADLGRVGDTIGKEKIIGACWWRCRGARCSGPGDTLAVILVGRVSRGWPGPSSRWPSASSATSSRRPGWPGPSASCRPSSASARGRGSCCRADPRAPELPLAVLDPARHVVGATVATFFFVPESPVRAPAASTGSARC